LAGLSRWVKALLPLLMAAGVVGLDQATKLWVTENVGYHESLVVLPALDGWLNITQTHNSGAAFGILPQANLLFIIIAISVVIAIVAYYRYLPDDGMLVRVSLGLQLGGALGNLVDRLRFGYVIDFVAVGVSRAWPVTTFNVADFSIVSGVIILAYYLLILRPHPGESMVCQPSGAGDGTGSSAASE
jgi:signal peptidase II